MSETLAPGLQRAYDLAQHFHPKGSHCPTCDEKIRSVTIKGNKIVFIPCGCVFAEVRSESNLTINPEMRR